MNSDNEFIIPVDRALERFHKHLNHHDRTILSAKFGDGKSYFLQKFMGDSKVQKDYKFLTIYPVNYQVEDNRDIFELVKYDLLIQMFVQEVIKPDVKLTKAQALGWCLQLNAPSLAEGLLPIFLSLCLDEESTKKMAAFLTARPVIRKVKQKISNLTEPVRDKQIEQFLKEISKNPIVGQDVVTGIIQKGIADYKKEHSDKKIVLVIEDMDRIDPAHLFRILNVFSAHIDFNYRFGCDGSRPFIGSKFGLDKVIFVMSYENTELIYRHFYGEKTDFRGYINKFCSSNYFSYSFSKEKETYLYERMKQNTGVDPQTIRLLVKPDLLNQLSIREIVNAIENIDDFIMHIEPVNANRLPIRIHHGGLKIIAIMRRLGMTDNDIKERIVNCAVDSNTYKPMFIYLACFLAYCKNGRILNNRVNFRNSTRNGESTMFEIEKVDDYGRAECQYYTDSTSSKNHEQIFDALLDKVLGMVSA